MKGLRGLHVDLANILFKKKTLGLLFIEHLCLWDPLVQFMWIPNEMRNPTENFSANTYMNYCDKTIHPKTESTSNTFPHDTKGGKDPKELPPVQCVWVSLLCTGVGMIISITAKLPILGTSDINGLCQ